MAEQEALKTKPRIRRVSELAMRDTMISTPRGPVTVFTKENISGSKVEITADLDARTMNIKVPGRGTTVIPFESCKYWKYGMGVPKAE